MYEDVSIATILVGILGVLYVGYEIDSRRKSLQETFNVFDKQESKVGEALEAMVRNGQLRPYIPGQSA
jgi:hypothetical protein